MTEPHTRDELVPALRQMSAAIVGYFSALPPAQFFRGSEDVWSPAHHLQHLAQSNGPLAQAMRAPKLLLRLVSLGKAPAPGRSYLEIREAYREALAQGRARATGRYAPRLQTADQGAVVQAFAAAAEGVAAEAAKWGEPSLDEYGLPHPVLGRLSVREMLFFTLYHNSHHLDGVRSRLGEGGSKK